jgi:hypothetical protein
LSAIKSFSHPILPILRSHENHIVSVKIWAMTQNHTGSQALSSSFRGVQHYGIIDSLLSVLEAMGALTLAIHNYLFHIPGSLTLGQICRTRTAIQKRLLLLPTGEELKPRNIAETATETDAEVVEVKIYECCRLTAMIFGVAVVAPIPDTFHVLQIYVTHLKVEVEGSGLLTHTSSASQTSYSEDLAKFLLWMLVLGGIASLDKPERVWFVEQLARLAAMLDVDWCEVKEILGTFLWLESACGDGGKELWGEVEGLAR